MDDLPPVTTSPYNERKQGYFGELGEGANAHIKFLQTAITEEELDSIDLIENIPGSESWEVRDLFQRLVDQDRVTNEILPYLQAEDRVKFFNPLTLVLLPLDETGKRIERKVVYVSPETVEEAGGHVYDLFERPGFFRFRIHTGNAAFSSLEWNSRRVKVVAIDGQHRLSALKRWKDYPQGENDALQHWRIPAVMLGIFKAREDADAASVLEIARKTFVYINSRAETVNDARKILLDDESVNCICTQELVQASHENDCKPLSERQDSRVPLMFFDWRGEVRNHERIPGPAAIVSVEELRDWFVEYVLGDDNSDEQRSSLLLDDMVPPLQTYGEGLALSHEDALRVREQVRATILPGVLALLETFDPFTAYIKRCRDLERKAYKESDVAQHAFMRLRFGASNESSDLRTRVGEKYDELVDKFDQLKLRGFPALLQRDIGRRGVLSAFGILKSVHDEFLERTTTWEEFAAWFAGGLNAVFQDKWFVAFDDLKKDKRELVTHIAFDAGGSIINYKIRDVAKGFGALLSLLVVRHAGEVAELSSTWEAVEEDLKATLRKGLRRYHKLQLKDEFKGTQEEFKKEVHRLAEKDVTARMRRLSKYVELPAE